jgi:hypothetical protein
MKTFNKVLKVLAIIAAIIGVIYIVAAYGDEIVAWAKRTTGRIFNKRTRFFDIDEQAEVDDVEYDEVDAAELA